MTTIDELREAVVDGQAKVAVAKVGEGLAARAMAAALKVLKPYLVEQGVKSNGKVAIGTTQGDLHDIGKNLVAMMLEGSGYEIVDLGVDVPADKFVQAVREGANVVAMSALLIVGGAPITKTYADEIGADGYAEDASSAVRLVKEVLAV